MDPRPRCYTGRYSRCIRGEDDRTQGRFWTNKASRRLRMRRIQERIYHIITPRLPSSLTRLRVLILRIGPTMLLITKDDFADSHDVVENKGRTLRMPRCR